MSALPPPSPALLKFLRQAAAHPIRNGLLIALGAALTTTAVPLFLDDFLLLEGARLYLAGDPAAPVDALGLPDLFVFLEGGGQDLSGFAEPLVPWWTSPETRLAFWRPLSSLLVLFDVAVLKEGATALHVHSLLWYLALVGAVGLLYRALLPRSPRLQAVALSVFAMEDAHWLPIGWASNRNALVAGTFGVLAAWAHVRWRQDRWTAGALLAPVLLAAALLSGEIGLSAFVLLACWQLFADPRTTGPARLLPLLPVAVVVLGWLGLWSALGYGAEASALYTDPSQSPVEFLLKAPGRWLSLIGAALLPIPAAGWLAGTWLRLVLALQGLCALGLAVVVARRIGPWLQREQASTAVSWGALAGAAALLPALATYPLDRMLLLPGVGLALPVAAVMSALWDARYSESPGPQAALAGKLGFLVALVHLIGPGFAWHITSGSAKEGGEILEAAVAQMPVDDAALAGQHLMLLNGSDPNVALYLPHHRERAGLSRPDVWGVVTMSPADHVVWRSGPHSLGFRVDDPDAPPVTEVPLVRLLRDSPFPVGQPIRRPGLEVVAQDEQAREIHVTFDRALDDPGLVLLTWEGDRFAQWTPPPDETPVPLRWMPGPSGQ
jgi:hypothetical protein